MRNRNSVFLRLLLAMPVRSGVQHTTQHTPHVVYLQIPFKVNYLQSIFCPFVRLLFNIPSWFLLTRGDAATVKNTLALQFQHHGPFKQVHFIFTSIARLWRCVRREYRQGPFGNNGIRAVNQCHIRSVVRRTSMKT